MKTHISQHSDISTNVEQGYFLTNLDYEYESN